MATFRSPLVFWPCRQAQLLHPLPPLLTPGMSQPTIRRPIPQFLSNGKGIKDFETTDAYAATDV